MSARLIKSGAPSGGQVRPVDSPLRLVDDPLEAARRRIDELERELRKREQIIAGLPRLKEDAFKSGWAAGLEEGRRQAEDREAARIEAAAAGVGEALRKLDGQLIEIESVAAALACDCLEIMLGTADDLAAIVARMLGAQLAQLRAGAAIAIEVARSDFPDEAALAALADQVGSDRVDLRARDELAAGACIIKLELGRIAIGPDQQWPVLRRTLERLAEGDAA